MGRARGVLITGSCGLIGAEVARWFSRLGFSVVGIDNNQRATFPGSGGDTGRALRRLREDVPDQRHVALDIRDRAAILALMREVRPSLIVHAAAAPSHDRAAAIPFLDFEVNAMGTLNLLEAARQCCPESPFIHMSTNEVYGDRPNALRMVERETRWDYAEPADALGISERLSIDQTRHSLFGASRVAADVLVQEYGRCHGMPTCCLRAGSLTGPARAGAEPHDFLGRLVKCSAEGREYKVFG